MKEIRMQQNKENKSHREQFKEQIKKAKNTSKDAFFTWFDGGDTAEACFVKGAWDFANYISQFIFLHVKEPEKKTVLEIGYGGGRVLGAASQYFKNAIGIDIHECQDTVLEELRKRGISNVKLYTTDGKTIPCLGASVDMVYSFIVLQHVATIDIFESYLRETYRVLKPGGIAVLYFGRFCHFSLNQKSKLRYFVDDALESFFLTKGYKELESPVNCINLLVSKKYMKQLSKNIGFQIILDIPSYKPDGNGNKIYGLQNGLVIKK
jgi:ubiquinone/menaquinone biosynthesis C-methylase UbiE